MSKKIETLNVTDVINVTRNIGDSLANQYEKTKDLKIAQTSLAAYKTAINGAKAQIIYKKITGSPERIDFFEDKTSK